MNQTFFFYDLETSGVSSRTSRIMQFGGQRTDMDLKPIGGPVNTLIKLSDDILPDPDAILITGITPQQTIAEGITELEFVKLFDAEINQPDTIFVGFNNIRFDDEFMRFLFWRNFYDTYEWQWKDGRSRWDILDLSRITRALRPDGIKWPFSSEGKPTNSLEYLTSVNKLDHSNAHDALADVKATISVASLIKQKQTKLFDYMFKMRGKKQITEFVFNNEIFVYASGKYSGEFEKTTVVATICEHPDKNGILVYDLRNDPKEWVNLSPEELAESWKWKKDQDGPKLPVKSLQFNRAPAIAPLGVLDDSAKKRLKIDLDQIIKHKNTLKLAKNFVANLLKATEILNKDRLQTDMIVATADVDIMLYNNFINDRDKKILEQVRSSSPDGLNEFADKFQDDRLKQLLPLFKARNYPKSLVDQESIDWDNYKKQALLGGNENSRFAKFNKRLIELSEGKARKLSDQDRYILEELRLYAESILPEA